MLCRRLPEAAASGAPLRRSARRSRSNGSRRGQALVETALTLPFLAVVLALAYTTWSGLNAGIGLVGAARAGAIVAADQLGGANLTTYPPSTWNTPEGGSGTETPLQIAEDKAAAAVNSEENSGVTYVASHNGCTPGEGCVTISAPTGPLSSVQLVKISITTSVGKSLPMVNSLTVHASASAKVPT